MKNKKYKTASALLTALSDRLKQKSQKEGLDIQRLRRQVAFDRLLVRLFSKTPSPWVLKGGYAMELRLNNPRATKDIVLTVKDKKLFSNDPITQNFMTLRVLRSFASIDLKDFFIFQIEESIMDLAGPVYGGARFPVVAQVDGRLFVRFNLDVGADNILIKPLEIIKGPDWLGFAGIHTKSIPILSIEQHFAEKIHAYTLPRDGQMNSRVKDLIDMILLIRTKRIKSKKLQQAIEKIFKHRNSHEFPGKLQAPPREWKTPFSILAKECSLSITLEEAFKEIVSFMTGEIMRQKKEKPKKRKE